MVFGRTGCDRWDVLNLEAPAEGEMTRRRRTAEEDKSLSLFKEHNYCQVIVREINVCAEDVLTLCEVSKGGGSSLTEALWLTWRSRIVTFFPAV